MINILRAGIAVNDILTSDPSVSAIVGTNIYPIVIPDEDDSKKVIKYPKIVYRRVSFNRDYAKGCQGNDSANVVVDCWHNSYKESIELAEKVIEALDKRKGEFNGVIIRDIRVLDVSEDYFNPFVQSITFNLK